jgi:hypothetical protein
MMADTNLPTSQNTSEVSDHEETEQFRTRVSRVARYFRPVTKDTDYAIWRDVYLPLRAVRAADLMKPVAPRHTLTEDEIAQLRQASAQTESHKSGVIIFKRGDPGDNC